MSIKVFTSKEITCLDCDELSDGVVIPAETEGIVLDFLREEGGPAYLFVDFIENWEEIWSKEEDAVPCFILAEFLVK